MELKKIFKYQQGGSFNPFFTIYKPVEVPPRQEYALSRRSNREEREDKESGKLSEKDLFLMLEKLDGLPNEMYNLKLNIARTLLFAQIAGDGDISNLYSTYINTLYGIKSAKFNKDEFDKVYNKVLENGSISDIAIASSGQVYTMDSNKNIKLLTPELLAKNSDKYKPLTVGNVLWFRSKDPNYVDNNMMMYDVSGSVTLEDVDRMIKSTFDKVGKSESSVDLIIPKEVVKGYKTLEHMISLGPDGYYKVTLDNTNYNEAQVDAVIEYIYATLPTQAKSRLKLETSDGTTKSAKNFIKQSLLGTLDLKAEYSASYMKEISDNSTESGGKESAMKDNIATKLIKGYGAIEIYNINLGDEYPITVRANTLPLVGEGDKELGVRKPISDVTKSSLNGILDLRSASMGGAIISSYELNRIVTDESKIRTIDYPCIKNRDGTIIPNMSPEVQLNKREADAELQKMGINAYDIQDITNYYSTINQIYQKHKLQAPYNPDGSISDNTWARFAVISVAADGRALEDANKSLLKEVTDDYEAESIISAILESDKNYTPNKPFLGFGGDAIYKGTMWIPLFESYNAATATQSLSESSTRQMDARDQVINNRSRLTNEQP